ncbi:DUF262 domain-containing protein [Campylobacter sp. JMF_08 NE1]|uniref:DUF262 domain-containing protein n=1 Tax=Campylobacter sp. JMF_08 NE1 TaxID=2983821 RepID=UPI0022EA08D4|nr:DUF262 domain-containing protein [Campylobacter sp. JMF_08 NE1]MDA3047653.1 DUF262 domain-containing protein [Campylobacter sp. JMF_08 NE1]
MELKSIKDLLDYKFKVPSYQRGYRWEKTHVEALLNDILEFSDKQNDEFYCLQPLMVKPINVEKNINLSKIKDQADENGDIEYEKLQNLIDEAKNSSKEYSVIDGQQRLTTIYLILKILDEPNFELDYDRNNVFKNKFTDIRHEIYKSDESADEFYISNAIIAIKDWADKHKNEKENFIKSLKEKVKFIWYELDEKENEKEVFARINSGKIPLTNAELIKATLINECKDKKDKIELAKEWDEIEYYLQNDEVWGFLTTAKAYPTRIELIFEICLNQEHKDDDKYVTFYELQKRYKPNNTNKNKNDEEKNHYEDFWKEVKQTFLTLRYWYEDYEIYHLVGFLVAANLKIESIYKEAKEKEKTKSSFKVDLKSKIKEKIKKDELEKLEYGKNNQDITNILLLFNIATILNSGSNFTRFSFNKFNKEKWSLEHIHARNEEEIKGFEQQKKWLNDLENYVKNEDLKDKIKKFSKDDNFAELKEEIYKELHEESGTIDEVKNLALLSARLNSELNHGVFPKKREKIKEMDERGEFIPICTKNVFMKYYSDGNNKAFDRFKWTNGDMEKYLETIKETLENFFNKDKQ